MTRPPRSGPRRGESLAPMLGRFHATTGQFGEGFPHAHPAFQRAAGAVDEHDDRSRPAFALHLDPTAIKREDFCADLGMARSVASGSFGFPKD